MTWGVLFGYGIMINGDGYINKSGEYVVYFNIIKDGDKNGRLLCD